MGDISPGAKVAVGIIVGLLSTCVQSIGLTLQRKSHMLEDEKEDYEPRVPPYRRRRWQIGMLLFLIANIVGSSIQITTLPLPLLSTLQASGLVFNSLLASLLLKEPWTLRTGYGTALVAAGAVLISLFSALPEPDHNLAQLLDLLAKPDFLVWFILSIAFVLAVLLMTWTLHLCVRSYRTESPRILLINGMSFGLVSGILSAHALLLAKSAVELIGRSLSDHKNQFTSYQPWLLVLAFLFLSLSQLYYLHLGLKLISTSILYPFVFCIYNIVAILDGLIYFRQMDRLSPLHAGLIALGTVLLLGGVLALSWRLQDDEDAERPAMIKAEIPQTVLAPGMGFVGEPDSETNESGSVVTDDDESEEEASERTGLVRKPLHRSSTAPKRVSSQASVHSHHRFAKHRHRAATLKEVRDIWDALGDTDEHYGTMTRPRSSTSEALRTTSPSHKRQQRRRRLSAGKALEPQSGDEDDPDNHEALVRRSRTMPSTSHSRSRRKSGQRHAGSALFSDLLKSDWWRTKRKDDDPDAGPSQDGHRRVVSGHI